MKHKFKPSVGSNRARKQAPGGVRGENKTSGGTQDQPAGINMYTKQIEIETMFGLLHVLSRQKVEICPFTGIHLLQLAGYTHTVIAFPAPVIISIVAKPRQAGAKAIELLMLLCMCMCNLVASDMWFFCSTLTMCISILSHTKKTGQNSAPPSSSGSSEVEGPAPADLRNSEEVCPAVSAPLPAVASGQQVGRREVEVEEEEGRGGGSEIVVPVEERAPPQSQVCIIIIPEVTTGSKLCS